MSAGETEPRIVSQTDRYVVIDKLAGMLSVPGRGPGKADCAAARVRAMFPGASGPMVCHRLDMETSGLMVLALDPEAQRAISMQFERRGVEKVYEAVLEGEVGGDEGEATLRMRLDVENRPRQIVDPEQGKESLTRWRVLERITEGGRARTRVEMRPLTGRSHQLRVHASTAQEIGGLGCPIVGDSIYGASAGEPRMLLHATLLGFDAPDTRERAVFESRAPF